MKLMIKPCNAAISAALALSSITFALPAHASLEGRDFDGNLATFEGFYDTTLNVTWLADANLFKTQYDANNGILQSIIAGTPTYTDSNGTYTLAAYDFTNPNGSNNGPAVDGGMTWYGAQAWVNYLNAQAYGGTGGWHLPTVSPQNGTAFNTDTETYTGTPNDIGYRITFTGAQLSNLYFATLGNGAAFDTAGNPVANWNGIQNRGPFGATLKNDSYWYGTENADSPGNAWTFANSQGFQGNQEEKAFMFRYALASVNGDFGTAAVPVPAAFWLLGSALAGMGIIGRRKDQASA